MTAEELKQLLTDNKKSIDEKLKEIKAAQEAAKTNVDTDVAALKSDLAELKTKNEQLQAQYDEQNVKMQNLQLSATKSDEKQSFTDGLKQLFKSEEFINAKKNKFREQQVFEVKASLSDITGTVNMTLPNMTVGFAPERQLAFIPYLNPATIGANKGIVMWVDGSYTSNVGYVGEGTANATSDAGTAVEKSRKMAKISAILPLTEEMLEDAEYVASAFRMKMQEKGIIFADGEFYSGDGSDATHPNHIYGILGQSTAFNATIAGLNAAIAKPNIGDVIDAALTQAKLANQLGLNVVWMNPADFMKMKKTKDANGQYLFVQSVNGQYNINGLQVIETPAVTKGSLTIANTNKIQIWWKRNPEIKFGQSGTDFESDQYKAVLFLRTQCVVETADKTAIVNVPDIAAAITALTAA